MPETLLSPELSLRFRDQAVEVAYALRSKTLLKGTYGAIEGYEIQTGPMRDPLILLANGDLKAGGPLPIILTRAVISKLDHAKGVVGFIGMNERGIRTTAEIRSDNPPY